MIVSRPSNGPSITAGEANLGTLSWTGGGAPGGATSKTYRWFRSGDIVQFMAKIVCANAGTLVTAVSVPLPSTVPSPALWATQESSGIVVCGPGGIQTAVTSLAFAGIGCAALVSDGSGGWSVQIVAAAGLAAKAAWCTLSWIA